MHFDQQTFAKYLPAYAKPSLKLPPSPRLRRDKYAFTKVCAFARLWRHKTAVQDGSQARLRRTGRMKREKIVAPPTAHPAIRYTHLRLSSTLFELLRTSTASPGTHDKIIERIKYVSTANKYLYHPAHPEYSLES